MCPVMSTLDSSVRRTSLPTATATSSATLTSSGMLATSDLGWPLIAILARGGTPSPPSSPSETSCEISLPLIASTTSPWLSSPDADA